MNFLIAVGLLLAMMLGWVVVEYVAYRFAQRHPEFGPHRKMGCGNCGNHCEGHCKSEAH